jgi:glycosyltransferase involved in cell wall biosynthesis
MTKPGYIVTHLYNDFSGSPRVLHDFCKSQEILKNETILIHSNTEGFLDGLPKKHWVFSYEFSNEKFRKIINFVSGQVRLFFKTLKAIHRMHSGGFKPVVICNTVMSIGAIFAAGFRGCLIVLIVHEVSSPSIIYRLIKFIVPLFSIKVVVVSSFVGKRTKISRDYFVLPNCLRSDFEVKATYPKSARFNNRNILFVGSLKTYKGVFELLEISRLCKDFNFKAAMNCSDDDLIKFLEINPVPNNLSLMARPDNLNELYQKSFLTLNLSRTDQWIETFGLTILEAMSTGCPCIVPPEGGHLDFFNEDCGLIIDSKMVSVISQEIELLGTDFKRWNKYSITSLEKSKEFSFANYSKKVDDFLQGLRLN